MSLPAPLRVLVLVSVGASAVLFAALIAGMAVAPAQQRADFLGLWLFSHFSHLEPMAGLYLPAVLHRFQEPFLPDHKGGFFPFAYPPHALLALWPLGYAPVPVAEAVWTALGMAAYVASLRLWFVRRLGWSLRRAALPILACAISPSAMMNTGLGETGFFTAALLIAGFAWLPARPALAGIAFGLLTMKPQLGVLVPFALAGLPAWRTALRAAVWAGVTVAVLALLSVLVFPAALWPTWIAHLSDYQGLIASSGRRLFATMGTIDAVFLTLGLPAGLAWAAQIVCSLAIAGLVVLAFRRAAYPLACCVLFAATVVAAPHGYVYDAQMLVPALITLLAARMAARGAARPGFGVEILAVLVYLLPLDLIAPFGQHMVFGIVELAFVAFAYRTALRAG